MSHASRFSVLVVLSTDVYRRVDTEIRKLWRSVEANHRLWRIVSPEGTGLDRIASIQTKK